MNNAQQLISVIIHNYKGLDRLERCILSIQESNYSRMEILVVDALTSGIEEWINTKFRGVKLLHFDRDYGIPARKNAALRKISQDSRYIVLMDEDIVVDEDWLQPLVRVIESHPNVGIVQPLMINLRQQDKVDNAGCYLDYFGYPHKIDWQHDRKVENILSDVSYAETAVLLLRREVLNKLPNPFEPFDPDYLVHWYDIDFCWKVLLSGYAIVIARSSVVYHERRLSAGSGSLPYRNIFLNTRNRLTTLLKNYSLLSLIKFLLPSGLLELTRIAILLKKNPIHAVATLRGIVWTSRNFRKIYAKRLVVQRFIRKVPDSYVLKRFLRPNLLRLYRDYHRNYLS